MIERGLVLLVIASVLGMVALWLSARRRRLTETFLSLRAAGRDGEALVNGRPTVLAFTSPDCAACHVAQRPALDDLATRVGDRIAIQEVDVLARPEIARAFGIFSVPSTLVADSDGRVVAFNIGFTSVDRLLHQLPALAGNGGAPSGK